MILLTLGDSVPIAALIIALCAVVGVITSAYVSVKALREVQYDRRQGQRPFLAFEEGSYRFPVKFVEGRRRPQDKKELNDLERITLMASDMETFRQHYSGLPEGSIEPDYPESPRGSIEPFPIGKLRNCGGGAALSIEVIYRPVWINLGTEHFQLNERQLSEPMYCTLFNSVPCDPGHIAPGEYTGMNGLPTFLEKDVDKKIVAVDAVLLIHARDVSGLKYEFHQQIKIHTNYEAPEPSLHLEFCGILKTIGPD